MPSFVFVCASLPSVSVWVVMFEICGVLSNLLYKWNITVKHYTRALGYTPLVVFFSLVFILLKHKTTPGVFASNRKGFRIFLHWNRCNLLACFPNNPTERIKWFGRISMLSHADVTIGCKNKPGVSSCWAAWIKEGAVFSSRCFSRIVCVATASCLSAFVLLFPVPGQSVEQESFVEPSQRVEREEGKTQEFSESSRHLCRARWHFLASVLKILQAWKTGLSLGTLDELLIERPPGVIGNWWLFGLCNVPSASEDNISNI